VDGDIPLWSEEGRIGCDIEALLVIAADVQRCRFDRSERDRGGRKRARDVLLSGQAGSRSHLRLVDRAVDVAVREALEDGLGKDEFADFAAATEASVAAHLGGALRGAEGFGVTVTPTHHPDAFELAASRSFRTRAGLEAHERGNRIRWTPTMRVTVRVALDGPRNAVQWSAGEVRSALWECGPVVEIHETLRLSSSDELRSRLRVLTALADAV
jgi:hypothetical protein